MRVLANPQFGGHAVLICQTQDEIIVQACLPFTITKIEPGELPKPTIDGRLGTAFLQSALDCAWENGFRPKGHKGEEQASPIVSQLVYEAKQARQAEINALKAHIEDLRGLVFGVPILTPKMEALRRMAETHQETHGD